MNILYKKLGYKYWYSVRLIYKNKKGERLFDFVTEFGLSKKANILNYRMLKKILIPFHKLNGVPKFLLCNGVVAVEPLGYLGCFKK